MPVMYICVTISFNIKKRLLSTNEPVLCIFLNYYYYKVIKLSLLFILVHHSRVLMYSVFFCTVLVETGLVKTELSDQIVNPF